MFEKLNELQNNILNNIPIKGSGLLHLAPRIGKTKIIIDLIKRDKPKSILWVTPSVKLAEEDIPNEFKLWGAEKYLETLTVSTWASLSKQEGEFDLIILDEVQFITPVNAVRLLNKELNGTIIGMTGTLSEREEKIDILQKLDLKILHRISTKEAVKLGFLADYTINVIMIEMGQEKTMRVGSKAKNWLSSEQANYNYLTKKIELNRNYGGANMKPFYLNRMRAIKNSPIKNVVVKKLLRKIGGRRLIFVPTIKQAKEICNYTYHSKSKSDRDLLDFQSGALDELCMVKSGGVGFTYKDIDHLVIVQVDSNKNGNSEQLITRTLLKQPDYKAKIWILCLRHTVDENWVSSTLSKFNRSKINYYNYENLEL